MRDLAFVLLILGVGAIMHAFYSDKATKIIAEKQVEVRYLPRESFYDVYFSENSAFKSLFEIS